MISAEWAKKLEELNKTVDIGFGVLERKLSGRMATDWILWESELDKGQGAVDRRWESLW